MATVVELCGVHKSFRRRVRSDTFRGLLRDLARPRREIVTALSGIDLAVEAADRAPERGAIAYDGSFENLRRRLGDRRRLVLETDSAAPPALPGATHLGSEGMRHEYAFDATAMPIPRLLAAAAVRARLVDVETHRAPIEDVIADLYRDWRSA